VKIDNKSRGSQVTENMDMSSLNVTPRETFTPCHAEGALRPKHLGYELSDTVLPSSDSSPRPV